jgi:hypothetical protein
MSRIDEARGNLREFAQDLETLRPYQGNRNIPAADRAWTAAMAWFKVACAKYADALEAESPK